MTRSASRALRLLLCVLVLALAHGALAQAQEGRGSGAAPVAEAPSAPETGGADHRYEGPDRGLADPKTAAYAAVVGWAVVYLLWLGVRGRGSRRRGWYPQWQYLVVLGLSVVGTGFLLHAKPGNPMDGVVKVFKAIAGSGDPLVLRLWILAFFLLLAVVANKAICGWACPFGALQELLHAIPVFRRVRKHKPPFWLTNGIRATLFVVTLLLLLGIVGGKRGFVVYHYLNPFSLFIFGFEAATVPFFIAAYLLTALVVYRPFCQFICPFGLVSWLVERVSLTRIRIDPARCTHCGPCARQCPLPAAQGRLEGKPLPADCFSCMRCLRVCPVDAIHYRQAWGPPSPEARAPGDESPPPA